MDMRGQDSSRVVASDEPFKLSLMIVQAVLGCNEMTTNDTTTLGLV